MSTIEMINHSAKLQRPTVWARLSRSVREFLFFTMAVGAIVYALYWGWGIRDEFVITAEYGLGYALGIIGGSMMLLLLVYPLRKRFPRSPWLLLSTHNWFRFHQFLGLAGPILILYHCNFSWGSINSNVVLISMLLMVSSGLIGRYVYSKIHRGIFGRKAKIEDLVEHKIKALAGLSDNGGNALHISETFVERLKSYESAMLAECGMSRRFFRILWLSVNSDSSLRRAKKLLRQDQRNHVGYQALSRRERRYALKLANRYIEEYFAAVNGVVELTFFERIFAIWHLLHMPIFFMLIITAFIHVYAVHVY